MKAAFFVVLISLIQLGSFHSVTLDYLEKKCHGFRDSRTNFVSPPKYVEKLGKMDTENPIDALKASIEPMCKMEFKNRLTLPQPMILNSTQDIFYPSLLGKFCGHELCPKDVNDDFGCRQTARCLCYLRETSELKPRSQMDKDAIVHIYWSGIPTSRKFHFVFTSMDVSFYGVSHVFTFLLTYPHNEHSQQLTTTTTKIIQK
jgi:hypothetical protein